MDAAYATDGDENKKSFSSRTFESDILYEHLFGAQDIKIKLKGSEKIHFLTLIFDSYLIQSMIWRDLR
jgi:hypothetical protein